MNRRGRAALLLAAALLAALALAACRGQGGPDATSLDSLRTLDSTRLMHERNVLRAEEEALEVRLAEARASDLPPAAREAAQRSLEDSLEAVQARRRAVDQVLSSGEYARNEMRYPVQKLILRAEPLAGTPPATEPPAPAAPAKAEPAPSTQASPAKAEKPSPPPSPAATAPPPARETPAAPAPRATGEKTPRLPAPAGLAEPRSAAAAAEAPTPPAVLPEPRSAATAANEAPSSPAAPLAPAKAPAPPSASPALPAAAEPPAAPQSPAAAARGGQARVLGVETARTAAGLEIRIRLEGTPGRRLFTLAGPPRIVLDLSGVAEPGFPLFNRTLQAVEARTLRLGWHNDRSFLRLVLDTDPAHLDRAVLEETGDGLLLRVTQ